MIVTTPGGNEVNWDGPGSYAMWLHPNRTPSNYWQKWDKNSSAVLGRPYEIKSPEDVDELPKDGHSPRHTATKTRFE